MRHVTSTPLLLWLVVLAILHVVPAGAVLQQPDGTPIPQGQSLQALFQSLGEPIDAVNDAMTTPYSWFPVSDLTVTLLDAVSLPEGCFGWYNESGSRPEAADLHVLVSCDDQIGTIMTLAIAEDPDYQGGDVGFFFGADQCSFPDPLGLTLFTNPAYDQDWGLPSQFIHVLIYVSMLVPGKYYLAFEDALQGDNDFCNLVISVAGVANPAGAIDVVPPSVSLRLTLSPSILSSPGQSVGIEFQLQQPGVVTLDVLTVDGRRVHHLIDSAAHAPGVYQARWDGRDGSGRLVPRGLYFINLRAGSHQATHRVVALAPGDP
jgi:hypothetical protein